MSIQEKMKQYAEHFNGVLEEYFASQPTKVDLIGQAVQYSIVDGGKRIRPMLVYMGAEFCGKDMASVDSLALGIEMIHSYSLVHDDLPCMDNDELRRGKPTTHKKFGEAMGVLAGDGLLNLAFETMLENVSNKCDIQAISYMAKCSGINGMIGGQVLDIFNTDKQLSVEDIWLLNSLKTSCLIKAALVGSCIKCGADEQVVSDMERYAENMGIIFQLVDDILDVHSTTEIMGKTVGKDNEQNKNTYLSRVGEEKTRKTIQELYEDSIDCVKKYGNKAKGFVEFAKYLTARLS